MIAEITVFRCVYLFITIKPGICEFNMLEFNSIGSVFSSKL